MTAALLRWWTVQGLLVIRTHPVLVRAVMQKNLSKSLNSWCWNLPERNWV